MQKRMDVMNYLTNYDYELEEPNIDTAIYIKTPNGNNRNISEGEVVKQPYVSNL